MIEFEEHRRLLKQMAAKFHRRTISAGARSVQIEDVYQEMCVAWCMARNAWNPQHQVPFTAFLVNGVRHHTNRWIGKQIWHASDLLELDAEGDGLEGDGNEFHNIIPDGRATSPEDATIEADDRRLQRELLSEDALKFLEILENPPPALFQILDAMRAKREYAEQRGVAGTNVARQIKAPLVFDVMGIDRLARNRVVKELKAYAGMEMAING